MTDITIGFSTTNKLISRIIRFITRGKASHAWISFYDSCLDTRLVLQAEAWGYELRPLKRWLEENKLVAEFKVLSDNNLDESLRWISQNIGVKYDWTSALFAGISGIYRWTSRGIKKILRGGFFGSKKRLMCSEAVIRFLNHAQAYSINSLDPELTSPSKLLEVVSKSSEFEKVL